MNSFYNPKVNFIPKTNFFQTLVLKIYNLQIQIRIRFSMAKSIIFELKIPASNIKQILSTLDYHQFNSLKQIYS